MQAVSGPAAPRVSLEREWREPEERVLAVDDDPQALHYIRDTLAGAGYQPVIAGDRQEAVRLMDQERPHLALLNLLLCPTPTAST